jgi:hypothetical protein
MVHAAGLTHPDMFFEDMLLGAPQPTTHCEYIVAIRTSG